MFILQCRFPCLKVPAPLPITLLIVLISRRQYLITPFLVQDPVALCKRKQTLKRRLVMIFFFNTDREKGMSKNHRRQ